MRKALLAATVLTALPFVASAQPVNGLYIGGGAGANWRLNGNYDANWAPPGEGTIKTKSNVGVVGVASIGWGFGNGLRAELEGSIRQNALRSLNLVGDGVLHNTGYLQTYGVMANAFYDFNGLIPNITPYVGVGVGYGWNDVKGPSGFIPRGQGRATPAPRDHRHRERPQAGERGEHPRCGQQDCRRSESCLLSTK